MRRATIPLPALLAWLFALWTAWPAQAHPPYVEPVAKIAAPDGRSLKLEILFGDGIFWEDPRRGQLRDTEGKVVGRTPVGTAATGSCGSPEPSTCRIRVRCGALFPRRAWVPDMANVDWEARTFTGSRFHHTGDPYPEHDTSPAPVGFTRDLHLERAEASLVQLPFMFAHIGPALAFSLLVGSWWGAVYATRRARLAELRWRGKTAGSRALGIALWLAVVLLAFPILGLAILVSYWGFSFWLVAFLVGCAVALLRRVERRLFPPWLWAWEDMRERRKDNSSALPSPAERTSLPDQKAPSQA